jgi:hypothetical protein
MRHEIFVVVYFDENQEIVMRCSFRCSGAAALCMAEAGSLKQNSVAELVKPKT